VETTTSPKSNSKIYKNELHSLFQTKHKRKNQKQRKQFTSPQVTYPTKKEFFRGSPIRNIIGGARKDLSLTLETRPSFSYKNKRISTSNSKKQVKEQKHELEHGQVQTQDQE